MIKIGDLVIPKAGREFLFSVCQEMSFEAEVEEFYWDENPGIVINVLKVDDIKEYSQVEIVVGNTVGWTYSDWIKRVKNGK